MGFFKNLTTAAPIPTVDHSSQWELLADAYLSAYADGSLYAPLQVSGVMRAREMNATIPAALPVRAAGVEMQGTFDQVASIIYELQDHGDAYLYHQDGQFQVLQYDHVTVNWDASGTRRVYTGTDGKRLYTTGALKNLEVIAVNRTPEMLHGVGWMQSGIIENLLAQTNWASEYFKNNAAPTGIVEVPGMLTEDQAGLLKGQWKEGADSRDVRVLSGGMSWRATGFSATDSEYVQGHLAGIGDIAALAGVPAYFLSYSPAGTSLVYSSTSELWRMYWAETLSIYVHRIETAWSRIMGVPVVFDPEQLLIASLQERSQAASVLVAAGYDPVQVADICGLPPMNTVPQEVPQSVA